MTEIRFKLLNQLITTKDWDLFMWVEMGVDRIHHGFWRYHDPDHRLHEPGNPWQNAIRDYYRQVDEGVGKLLERIDDDTCVLVVSDHGVSRMDGGVCLNEWLWKNGWLHFKNDPPEGQKTRFEDLEVDWTKTRAWGDGGYYGRLFVNVQGREEQGVIPADAVEDTLAELDAALNTITDAETGQVVSATCYRPEKVYSTTNKVPPDLIVYFGDLHYRSIGSLGHGAFTIKENDTGPDDANHGQQGMFIWYDPASSQRGMRVGHQLMDVAPTLLHSLGVDVPIQMQGHIIA
jgi:predicted AlkP superfamily phosphohydrolase/phosphomutase